MEIKQSVRLKTSILTEHLNDSEVLLKRKVYIN